MHSGQLRASVSNQEIPESAWEIPAWHVGLRGVKPSRVPRMREGLCQSSLHGGTSQVRVGADRVGYQDSGNTPELSAQCELFCLVSNNCKQFVNYWIEACLCTRIFCPISQNVNICNSAVFSTQGLKLKKKLIFFQLCTFSNSGMGVEKYTDTATFKRS